MMIIESINFYSHHFRHKLWHSLDPNHRQRRKTMSILRQIPRVQRSINIWEVQVVKTRSHDHRPRHRSMQVRQVNTKIVHLKLPQQIPMQIQTQKSQHRHYQWMKSQIIKTRAMESITTTTVNNFQVILWMDQTKFCLHHQLIGRILISLKLMVSWNFRVSTTTIPMKLSLIWWMNHYTPLYDIFHPYSKLSKIYRKSHKTTTTKKFYTLQLDFLIFGMKFIHALR